MRSCSSSRSRTSTSLRGPSTTGRRRRTPHGDWPTARHHFERATEIHKQRGDIPNYAASVGNLGLLTLGEGDLVAARPLLEEARSSAAAAGSSIALALLELTRGTWSRRTSVRSRRSTLPPEMPTRTARSSATRSGCSHAASSDGRSRRGARASRSALEYFVGLRRRERRGSHLRVRHVRSPHVGRPAKRCTSAVHRGSRRHRRVRTSGAGRTSCSPRLGRSSRRTRSRRFSRRDVASGARARSSSRGTSSLDTKAPATLRSRAPRRGSV